MSVHLHHKLKAQRQAGLRSAKSQVETQTPPEKMLIIKLNIPVQISFFLLFTYY